MTVETTETQTEQTIATENATAVITADMSVDAFLDTTYRSEGDRTGYKTTKLRRFIKMYCDDFDIVYSDMTVDALQYIDREWLANAKNFGNDTLTFLERKLLDAGFHLEDTKTIVDVLSMEVYMYVDTNGYVVLSTDDQIMGVGLDMAEALAEYRATQVRNRTNTPKELTENLFGVKNEEANAS